MISRLPTMSTNDHEPVTIVTGGTYGLGLDVTIALAKAGHRVLAFGLSSPQVSSTAQGFTDLQERAESLGLSEKIKVLEADVSSAKDTQLVATTALEHFGRIDGLVNNAAIGPLGTVLSTDEALFMRILEVNLKGAYLMSRAVLPHLIAQGGGSIVNVGSGAGYGKPGMAAYASSKGGLLALSTAMAYDHFHEGVRVNVVIPGGGGIVTGMSVGRFGGDVEKFTSRPSPGTVAGRPMSGADMANAIGFLLSPAAVAISGTVIDVGCFSHQGGPVPIRSN